MSFWVVKYDVNSFVQGVDYSDMSVEPPHFIRPSYADYEKAVAVAEGMGKSNCGEDIDVILKNGKPYKGPRYVYRVAEDDKPAEEPYYAEETANPV
jgi:hypothetical protein